MQMHFITCPTYTLPPFRMPWRGPNCRREDAVTPAGGLPCFRFRFPDGEKPVGAIVTATALGTFELYCNGSRVGEVTAHGTVYDELKPGTTDFRHRVHAYSYDLTPYLSQRNKLVAVVAPGWWSGRISFGAFGLQPPAFGAVLRLSYRDGRSVTYTTEEGWECAVAGPTLAADLYDGEYVDARMPHPADEWEPYEWTPAIPFAYRGKVEPLYGPPVRVREDLILRPVSATLAHGTVENGTAYGALNVRSKRVGNDCCRTTVRPGDKLILDLGQNIAGRPRLTVSAPTGAKCTLTMGEMLNDTGDPARGNDGPGGSVYVASYRSARSSAVYVAGGNATETFYPLFTYYGFRYLELTVDAPVDVLRFEGVPLTSEMKETGHIETDHPTLNRLISNIEWGRRANYIFTPTDCPQRDERLGWSGDTHIFATAGAYLSDLRSFMRKWLQDARDSQETHDGAYADVIPTVLSPVGDGFAGNAGWGDAGLIVPAVLYRMYGDRETLREHYPSMERYMEYLSRFGYKGGRTNYGDWLAYETTDKRYIAVAYYAGAAALMAEHSRVLSEDANDFYADRAAHYRDLYGRIRDAFRQRYVRDGLPTEGTQTGLLLALKFGLLEEEEIPRARETLLTKIRENGNRLSTGFLGTGILATTLSEQGADDTVYTLLLQNRDPSWLYSVEQGATTVWERWNSYTRERGFGDVSMNSFNHYAYGAVLEWMFSRMAGISTDPEKVGFEHILLSPTPDLRKGEDLPEGQTPILRVRAHYDSVRGRIESAWEWQGEEFVWHFTVPDGVSATVRFPLLRARAYDPEKCTVTVNGVSYTAGELCGTIRDGKLEFTLGGGRYEIR